MGFSNNPWVGPATGLDRGFDQFYGVWHKAFVGKEASKRFSPKVKKRIKSVMEFARYRDYVDSGGARTNKKVRDWFKNDRHPGNPYFIFINYMETHGTLKPPEPYRSRFYECDTPWEKLTQDFRKTISGEVSLSDEEWECIKQLQRGELAYIDSVVEDLVTNILPGDPFVIVTADHGDLFGEEDPFLGRWAGHKYSLHRKLLHVPFVLYGLGKINYKGKLFQHVDLFQTLIDLTRGYFTVSQFHRYGFAEHTNPRLFLEQFQDTVKPIRDGTQREKLLQHLMATFTVKGQLIYSDRYGYSGEDTEEMRSVMDHYIGPEVMEAPPPPTGSKLEFDEAERIMLNLGLF